MIKLLPHNQKTLNEVLEFTNNHQNVCVVNPCGSGKTFIMAAFIEKHPKKKFVIITKQKNAALYYQQTHSVFKKKNVKIVTYSKMISDYKSNDVKSYKGDYYLIDEAHYIEATKYYKAFLHLTKLYNPILVGFTATPQRFKQQGTDMTVVDTIFSKNSAGNFTNIDLQKQGLFVKPEYILSIYNLQEEIEEKLDIIEETDIADATKEYYRTKLKNILCDWEKNSNPETVLKNNLSNYMYKEKCNRILVYVTDLSSMKTHEKYINGIIKSIFPDKKIKSYEYTYMKSENEFYEFMQEDNTDIKILYAIDKIMETIHIDDLNIMIMLRPSVSNRIITQQFGRINNTKNKNKSLIIDMVNNLSNINKVSFLGLNNAETTKHQNTNTNTSISVNLKYIRRYYDVLSQIDKISQYETIAYKGFYGTLNQLSQVYRVDFEKLKNMINKGYTIKKALNELPSKKINDKTIENALALKDDDYIDKLSKINKTDEFTKSFEEHIYVVNNFINRKHIKNDDIKQTLYITYMSIIAGYQNKNIDNFKLNATILNNLNRRYIQIWQRIIIRKKYYNENLNTEIFNPRHGISNENTATSEDDIFLYISKNNINNDINDMLNHLNERERLVIIKRCGLNNGEPQTFEKISKEFGVGKERIRQIEAKALRKLRKISTRKITWLYDYNN